VIGDMPLKRIRMAGKAPTAVWVWVGIHPTEMSALWPEIPEFHSHPEVAILPSDRIELLDLRFAYGLQVHIDGDDSRDRILKAHRAFTEAGAKSVSTMIEGNLLFNLGAKIEHPAT
jgi:hypothetical protein